ncbi:MAG: homocysteine S-methyltransferase family protein [Alphaproteobacteria bacterium]
MPGFRTALPQLDGRAFICHTGLETDLIFNHGVDLPSFASFPLLDSDVGRGHLRRSCSELIQIAREAGVGVILESATWMANRDRAAPVNYGPETLERVNRSAIALMAEFRGAMENPPVVLSGNLGPRSDAYVPGERMTAAEAAAYHAEQIGFFADTEADLVSGYTLAYVEEAIGMVEAARRCAMPIALSFTVETDGRLPTGTTLSDAIATVDEATGGYAAYFMINCAHPDHFAGVLENEPPSARLKGIVVNASRCSHAELDEAEHLDDGDPVELGQQVAAVRKKFPHITVVGGCCGTDARHLAEIARRAGS